MSFPVKNVPSLYIENEGEKLSVKVALSLTKAKDTVVVRLTGGCGFMSDEHAQGMFNLFGNVFRGFRGAVLFGGTQMRSRSDPTKVVLGITEIAPIVRELCPDSYTLGVVARQSDLQLTQHGLVVADNPEDPYFTIAHPNQDTCLIVQASVDQKSCWDTEYETCAEIVQHLVTYGGGWRSLLLTYNGGGITEKEILLWAKRAWPVLLIRGSGRTTDRYANDKEFLLAHPHVHVAELTEMSLRHQLEKLSIVPKTESRFRLVERTGT